MDIAPTIADLLTFSGLVIAVNLVLELVKRAARPSPEFMDRFGPLLAIAFGLVIGGGAAMIQHFDVVGNAYTGFIAGLSAIGLYQVAPDGAKFGTVSGPGT